ncbi:MAG: hypothetical protein A3C36_01645 [Omnitrophica WOR_2 bacterium RIFCSPHIGHO2_02_FULL_52_10]|nr:MAG: hypothetical protein A3C36_01645 [Omnitrophica WOR_2 bacterium RIFCSPHIGHO2_02_FULL_52_10]
MPPSKLPTAYKTLFQQVKQTLVLGQQRIEAEQILGTDTNYRPFDKKRRGQSPNKGRAERNSSLINMGRLPV